MLSKLVKALVVGTTFGCAVVTHGITSEEAGIRVAKEYKAADVGWGNTKAEVIMVLRNAAGEESKRQLHISTLEMMDEGDKTLVVFDHPGDIRGSAFLSFSHINSTDDQWLYLPAVTRVKRIASENQSGPFVGSDFSYEDMNSFEVEKFTYRLLLEEKLNGVDCYVLESVPVNKYSGYSRQVSWIDKVHKRTHKIDFYDRKNALLKMLQLSDYRLYNTKYWRAGKSEMINHQNGKSTTLIFQNISFGAGLNQDDFNVNSLKRAH